MGHYSIAYAQNTGPLKRLLGTLRRQHLEKQIIVEILISGDDILIELLYLIKWLGCIIQGSFLSRYSSGLMIRNVIQVELLHNAPE